MLPQKLSDIVLNSYLNCLHKHGEDVFYRRLIGLAFLRYADGKEKDPHVKLADLSECLFSLARRTGRNQYFEIAKILRRAAHTVYRELLRQNKDVIINDKRFLSLCGKL